jgi:hypothetical protein
MSSDYYNGDVITSCGTLTLDFSKVAAVAVSGDSINACGHLLLCVGARGIALYFHVAGGYGQPRSMSEAGYARYLRESEKQEWKRVSVRLPKPKQAEAKLESLLAKDWLWLGVPNNCVSFVEEVIAAGGGGWSSSSNCPAIATRDSDVLRFLNLLEASVYAAYGVPRLQ